MIFFRPRKELERCRKERLADGWVEVRCGKRDWEELYRRRWQHDKVVRSTHGVNCTGSCSWKVYVKDGIIVWETQEVDYPSNGPDLPEYEPRGCPRGATYSSYIYSPLRVKYPYIRSALYEMWLAALRSRPDPVSAWASIVEDPEKSREYKAARGQGGLVRFSWDEAADPDLRITHLHHPQIRARPHLRVHAHSRHVHGGLLLRDPLPVAHRRRPFSASTTGTATSRPPPRRSGASRPMFRRAPTGMIPAT